MQTSLIQFDKLKLKKKASKSRAQIVSLFVVTNTGTVVLQVALKNDRKALRKPRVTLSLAAAYKTGTDVAVSSKRDDIFSLNKSCPERFSLRIKNGNLFLTFLGSTAGCHGWSYFSKYAKKVRI